MGRSRGHSVQFKLTIPAGFSISTLGSVTISKLRCSLSVIFVKVVYDFFVSASGEISRSSENVYYMTTRHGQGLGEQLYATVDTNVYRAYQRLTTGDRKYIISMIRANFLKELAIIEERGEENYKPLGIEGLSMLVRRFEIVAKKLDTIDYEQMEGAISGKIYRKENPNITDETANVEE